MTATSDNHDATAGHEATAGTRQAIRDGLDDARTKASEAAQAALTRTKDGIEQARGAVVGVYAGSRERAIEAYAAARDKASGAGKSAGEGLEAYPIAALLGGIAIGAALGALLPRTERERQMLGPIGERLQDAARDAADAAKEAGREKLAELGLTPDQARATFRVLVDNVVAAATTATDAAIESAKKSS